MKYLSQEYLDEQRAISQEFQDRPGASARIQNVVSGGPDGEVRYYWLVENGKFAETGLGDIDDPDFTLTVSYDNSVKLLTGELNPQVALMTGKLKVRGAMGKLLSLLPLTQSEDFKSMQDKLRTAAGL